MYALHTQGTEDEVIDISCAKKLASLAKNAVPPLWAKVRRGVPHAGRVREEASCGRSSTSAFLVLAWPQGFNHQNLEACPSYLPTLASFIAQAMTQGAQQQRS